MFALDTDNYFIDIIKRKDQRVGDGMQHEVAGNGLIICLEFLREIDISNAALGSDVYNLRSLRDRIDRFASLLQVIIFRIQRPGK